MINLATTSCPGSTRAARHVGLGADLDRDATLITEHEVLFSTTAAVALPPAENPSLERHRPAPSPERCARCSQPPKSRLRSRHYPKHYGYLENALMSRKWTGCELQLASGLGLITSEYGDASPATTRLWSP